MNKRIGSLILRVSVFVSFFPHLHPLITQTDLMKWHMYDTPIHMPLLACYQDVYLLFSVYINTVWPPLTYITL